MAYHYAFIAGPSFDDQWSGPIVGDRHIFKRYLLRRNSKYPFPKLKTMNSVEVQEFIRAYEHVHLPAGHETPSVEDFEYLMGYQGVQHLGIAPSGVYLMGQEDGLSDNGMKGFRYERNP